MTSPFEQDDLDQFDDDLLSYCFTVVGHGDVDAVVGVLLPRREPGVTTWAGARDRAMEELDPAGGSPIAAAAGASGGWTWVWESNGYQGSIVRTMTRLSDLGRAISVFRNGASISSFVLAEGRRVVRRFDPLRYGKGRVSGTPLADEPLLDWTRPGSAAMTLLANLSGLYPEWPKDSDGAFVYFN